MKAKYNLLNQQFGKLTVKEKAERSGYWLCDCDCGTKGVQVSASSLVKGSTKSCGCLRKEVCGKYNYEDFSGKIFGRLTVIKRDETKKRTYWICNCSCGKEGISISSQSLKKGITSCGCERIESNDLTGQRFGRLVVVGRSEKKTKKGEYYWICKCDCGNTVLQLKGNITRKDGYKTVSCGCYKEEIGKNPPNKDFDREEHIVNYLYGKLKVRNKKIGFDNKKIISKEIFKTLINEPCQYCGLVQSNTSKDTVVYDYGYVGDANHKRYVSDFELYHNGIDRIDSSMGYVEGNVVSCCKYCNMAKSNRSTQEFLEWVEQVYDYYIDDEMKEELRGKNS